MNREPPTTRAVRSWLQFGVTQLPDRVLDRVIDQVTTTTQRRRPWSIRLFWAIAVAALLALAVFVGSSLLPISLNVADPPPTAIPTPRITSPLHEGALEAGTHTVEGVFDVDVVFAVPAEWSVAELGADHVEIVKVTPDPAGSPPAGMGLGFFLIDNLFFDPCAPDDRLIDPPIGPTVEDLANGFANVSGYRASPPIVATVDGYRGLRVDLDVVFYMCLLSEAHLWTTPTGWIHDARGHDELNTLWILDVEGVRLVIDRFGYPSMTAEDHAELDAIVESIRFEP